MGRKFWLVFSILLLSALVGVFAEEEGGETGSVIEDDRNGEVEKAVGSDLVGENGVEGTEASSGEGGSKSSSGEDGTAPESSEDYSDYFAISCTLCSSVEEEDDSLYDPYDSMSDDGAMVVYAYKNLMDVWKTCSDDETTRTGENCYVHDIYTDEIQFAMSYVAPMDLKDRNLTDFKPNEPTVRAVEGESAKNVEVASVKYESDSSMSYVAIKYNCEPANDEINLIEMSADDGQNKTVTVKWLKICGQGVNDKFVLKYQESGTSLSKLTLSDDPEQSMTVPYDDASTQFFIELLPPARSQSHESPMITTDPEILSASVRGYGAFTDTVYAQGQPFQVHYACKAAGVSVVQLIIPIRPFEPVVKKWRKECQKPPSASTSTPDDLGTGTENDASNNSTAGEESPAINTSSYLDPLDIGSTSDQKDVMVFGVPTREYSVEFKTGLETMDHHHRIPANVTSTTFYAQNPVSSSMAHVIDWISITIRGKHTLLADVIRPKLSSFSYLSAAGGSIAPGETSKIEIRFICKAEGEAPVLVTLASQYHSDVEFGFVKVCKKPEKYTGRTMFRTAKSLFNSVIFLTILIMCCGTMLYRNRRKRTDNTYTPVASAAP